MKQNIFIIGYDTAKGDEDIITSYWAYVLEAVPGLGQGFADYVSAAAGLPATEFIGCLDHPVGDAGNHPDLLLQGHDWQVVFEHKVSAALGPLQLERYQALANSRGWTLAVMAAEPLSLTEAVLTSPGFVRPIGSGRPPHFLWSDLLPLLRASGHHLATEFAEFIEYRGLAAYSWGGRGDPWFDETARAALLNLYGTVGTTLRAESARCSFHAKSLIYKVSGPHKWIHLLNFGPIRSVAQQVPRLRGPVLGAWFWIRRRSAKAPRRLSTTCDGPLQGTELPITVWNREHSRGLTYEPKVFNEREYYVPLDFILVDDMEEASRRVLAFVRTALDHVRLELDGGAGSRRVTATHESAREPDPAS